MHYWEHGSLRITTGSTGSLFLLVAALAPVPSWALFDDKLEVFVSENVTHDSNVFRISDKVDPLFSIGSPHKGDTIYRTAVGFILDVPISLQRLQMSYALIDHRYDRFTDVNYRGHDARAAYQWAYTTRLTGELGYTEQETLATFANIQGRRPDLVTARMAYANAAWMVTPSWRVHGVATASQAEHSENRALQDLESHSVETGVSYVTAQENRIGVAVRAERGKSPDERFLAGAPFDNEYRQEGIGIQGRWVVTGHSRFDGRLDYTRRRYEQLQQRNYSGPTFEATYTWTPTGKLTIATTAQRGVAPLEDVTTSFVLVTGLSIRPDWAVSDKVSVRGNFAYAKWEYRGDTAVQPDFEHRVKTAGISVLYRPFQRVSITGSYAREQRTSTLLTGDYKVDVASIEARIGF